MVYHYRHFFYGFYLLSCPLFDIWLGCGVYGEGFRVLGFEILVYFEIVETIYCF